MHATLAEQDRWLVGFPFRTSQGAVGRHYFVIGQAADADDAVAIAMLRTPTPHLGNAGEEEAEIDGVEVRRLRWNPLGWVYLA